MYESPSATGFEDLRDHGSELLRTGVVRDWERLLIKV